MGCFVMELNNDNIKNILSNVQISLTTPPTCSRFLVVPPIMYTDEIDRSKYKGKGRPKQTDYVSFSPADEIRKLWS